MASPPPPEYTAAPPAGVTYGVMRGDVAASRRNGSTDRLMDLDDPTPSEESARLNIVNGRFVGQQPAKGKRKNAVRSHRAGPKYTSEV